MERLIGDESTGGRVTGAGLKRELGLLAMTTLVIGEVIAVGIFLTPSGMATSLGLNAAASPKVAASSSKAARAAEQDRMGVIRSRLLSVRSEFAARMLA